MITKYSQLYFAGATKQQIDSAAKKLNMSSEELLSLVNDADPTKEKKFEAWLIKQLVFKNIRLPEDAPRVLQTLQNFIVYGNKKKLKNKDVNQYQKIHDLEEELDSLREVAFDPREKMTVETLKSFPGVEVYKGDSGVYVIAAVSNVNSLEILGLGTKWCTRKDYAYGSLAHKYISESHTGRVYIVYEVQEDGSLDRKYQFEDTFDQVMDENDQRISIDSYLELDISEMFFSLRVPNMNTALFYLYENTGNEYELQEIINNGSLPKKILEEYYETHFSRAGSSPTSSDFYNAINVGLKCSVFEYVDLYVNPEIDSYLEYAIMADEKHDIEEHLVDEDIFENRHWEEMSLPVVLRYYKEVVLKETTEASSDEEDKERIYSANDRLEKWRTFLSRILLEDDPRVNLGTAQDLFEVIKITKLSPEKIKKVLSNDPEIYENYKQWLLKEGHIPALIEHDYELSDKKYLGSSK